MGTTLIDREDLDRTSSEDPELISDLLEMFCESLPEQLMQFDRAVESGDTAAIRETAHVLKSRLRYLHCYGLGDLAAEIEKHGCVGDIAAVETKYKTLKSGICAAVVELREYLKEKQE